MRYFTPLRYIALLAIAIIAVPFALLRPEAGVAAFLAGSLGLEMLRTLPSVKSLVFRAYTGVTLAEIFVPEIYGDMIAENSPSTSAFVQSGVVVRNQTLQEAAQAATRLVDIPIWNDLDTSVDPNISDDTDTEATVGKVDTTDMKARTRFVNKGYGSADLAEELSNKGSPMQHIKNRFGTYWQRVFQRIIVAQARGVLADNVANDSGDMIYDIASETGAAPADGLCISAAAVQRAVFTMGDRFNSIGVICMHSVPYAKLVSQQLIEFVRDAEGKLLYNTYLGLRVVVDDDLPVIAGGVSGFKYLTILFGTAAFGFGEGTPKVPVEIDRLPSKGNGGGLENIWERKTWLTHPFGFDWTDASVAGKSPTITELRTTANWDRKFYRKNIPLAFLQTNG